MYLLLVNTIGHICLLYRHWAIRDSKCLWCCNDHLVMWCSCDLLLNIELILNRYNAILYQTGAVYYIDCDSIVADNIEQFAVRFKTIDLAKEFKQKFEESKLFVKSREGSSECTAGASAVTSASATASPAATAPPAATASPAADAQQGEIIFLSPNGRQYNYYSIAFISIFTERPSLEEYIRMLCIPFHIIVYLYYFCDSRIYRSLIAICLRIVF